MILDSSDFFVCELRRIQSLVPRSGIEDHVVESFLDGEVNVRFGIFAQNAKTRLPFLGARSRFWQGRQNTLLPLRIRVKHAGLNFRLA